MTAVNQAVVDEIVTRRLRLVPYSDEYGDDVYALICNAGTFVLAPKEHLLPALLTGALATFVAVPIGSTEPAALVTLRNASPVDGHAELGVVCADQWRNSGVAVEAVAVVLAHAFSALGLRKVYLHVSDQNLTQFKGVGRYADLEGVLKGHQFRDGQPRDVSIYAFHRETFLAVGGRIVRSCERAAEERRESC